MEFFLKKNTSQIRLSRCSFNISWDSQLSDIGCDFNHCRASSTQRRPQGSGGQWGRWRSHRQIHHSMLNQSPKTLNKYLDDKKTYLSRTSHWPFVYAYPWEREFLILGQDLNDTKRTNSIMILSYTTMYSSLTRFIPKAYNKGMDKIRSDQNLPLTFSNSPNVCYQVHLFQPKTQSNLD